jgi:hypothetical protein
VHVPHDAVITIDADIFGVALKERHLHWRPDAAIAGPSATAMSDELASARAWAGAHFRSAVDAGRRIGRQIANDTTDGQLLPR